MIFKQLYNNLELRYMTGTHCCGIGHVFKDHLQAIDSYASLSRCKLYIRFALLHHHNMSSRNRRTMKINPMPFGCYAHKSYVCCPQL